VENPSRNLKIDREQEEKFREEFERYYEILRYSVSKV
jgi:hypothetical protein